LLLLPFTKHNQNELVKEEEMGRACRIHGGEEEYMKGFGGKARRKETTRKTYT
jgi:hypothetical protein